MKQSSMMGCLQMRMPMGGWGEGSGKDECVLLPHFVLSGGHGFHGHTIWGSATNVQAVHYAVHGFPHNTAAQLATETPQCWPPLFAFHRHVCCGTACLRSGLPFSSGVDRRVAVETEAAENVHGRDPDRGIAKTSAGTGGQDHGPGIAATGTGMRTDTK